MANRGRRVALRGAGEEIFDLLTEVFTSNQWAELLRAPLEHAAGKGNRGLTQKLVGASAEIGDALHEAVRGGHGDVVKDLLESGASVAAKHTSLFGVTSLHLAAREGTAEMVELLLLEGADKDALDHGRRTPLYLAASNGHLAAVLALLAAGADVSLRCGFCKSTIIHAAAEGGQVDILNAAIERGADVDTADSNQRTPLHAAACFNKVNAIDALVEAGAHIEARDSHGGTSLHRAASCASPAAVLTLLKHGAYVNAQTKTQGYHRNTPLHIAVSNAGTRGAAEVVDLLLRSGADETIINDGGRAAADVVGDDVEEEDQVAEDVDRVRRLLANAPADRAWRRRGYLVLCRAHPDRMQQMHKSSSACADVARRTQQSSAKLAKAESCIGTAGGSTVDERTGGDWAVVVARVLGVQEEGIFRSIVGYL